MGLLVCLFAVCFVFFPLSPPAEGNEAPDKHLLDIQAFYIRPPPQASVAIDSGHIAFPSFSSLVSLWE